MTVCLRAWAARKGAICILWAHERDALHIRANTFLGQEKLS